MDISDDLKYTKDHEWIRLEEDGTYSVGITDYAQEQLGDIVFVEMPEMGAELAKQEQLGSVESVKTVSDIFAPMSGTVVAVNGDLLDQPGAINESAYESWIVRLKISDPKELGDLLDAAEYEEHLDSGGKPTRKAEDDEDDTDDELDDDLDEDDLDEDDELGDGFGEEDDNA